jgi:competence protein ComEC
VGHGLAVVVRTHRHALAYDAGPAWSADSDSGLRIVVPFLRGEGIARLDGLVISHADDDHYGGAFSVARMRRPPWLLSPLREGDPLHEALDRSMRCAWGQRWDWDGVRFEVLHPAESIYSEEAGRKPRKENDRGCVVRVATAGSSALLTGDVEVRSEAEMLARGAASLRSEVLLVPHHGSKTSSSAPFLDAVSPRVGLVSLGYLNRFRHPHDAVIARYAERGVDLRRTDREGALRVVLGLSGPPVVTPLLGDRCRYWSDRPCVTVRPNFVTQFLPLLAPPGAI